MGLILGLQVQLGSLCVTQILVVAPGHPLSVCSGSEQKKGRTLNFGLSGERVRRVGSLRLLKSTLLSSDLDTLSEKGSDKAHPME